MTTPELRHLGYKVLCSVCDSWQDIWRRVAVAERPAGDGINMLYTYTCEDCSAAPRLCSGCREVEVTGTPDEFDTLFCPECQELVDAHNASDDHYQNTTPLLEAERAARERQDGR